MASTARGLHTCRLNFKEFAADLFHERLSHLTAGAVMRADEYDFFHTLS
jgi:hypothetical protein